MLVQLVTPMTSAMPAGDGVPSSDCKKTTISRLGTLSRISVSRISSASSQPGAMPLSDPNATAIRVETRVEAKPMNRDTRPPDQIMEKMSRPMVSVPKGNSPPGGRFVLARSM